MVEKATTLFTVGLGLTLCMDRWVTTRSTVKKGLMSCMEMGLMAKSCGETTSCLAGLARTRCTEA